MNLIIKCYPVFFSSVDAFLSETGQVRVGRVESAISRILDTQLPNISARLPCSFLPKDNDVLFNFFVFITFSSTSV